MTIKERIRESEKQFDSKKAEREQHLQAAEECTTEMTKLQGEYRLLQEMQADEDSKGGTKKPNLIEAIPDGEGK